MLLHDSKLFDNGRTKPWSLCGEHHSAIPQPNCEGFVKLRTIVGWLTRGVENEAVNIGRSYIMIYLCIEIDVMAFPPSTRNYCDWLAMC